ncbi:hypothetical protein [Mycobacterium sp.]|uniref:hypothetical protein n=1 Tax=Mycobacterium sp. TaxID=1785 RepID=UPI0025F77DF0|nr:hypothetical protein [Mycobacterium sp.]
MDNQNTDEVVAAVAAWKRNEPGAGRAIAEMLRHHPRSGDVLDEIRRVMGV